MKITCDSCGAKYTIADDKVSGRKVKIRCKGCGTPIVVDGAQQSSNSIAPARSNGAAAEADVSVPVDVGPGSAAGNSTWSVNLSETDQRTMTTQELVAGWGSGLVTSDAFVWKDGMADWMPILDCAEIANALKQPAAQATPARGSQPTASSRPSSSAAARVGGGRAQGAMDLFAGVDQVGADGDVAVPGHSLPQVHSSEEAKPTGARNENSVLFSLDALKAGFGANPKSQPPKASPPTSGSDDPFGLGGGVAAAPMFSLTDNSALLTAPAPPEPPPKPAVAFAAPGSIAPAPASKKGLILGIAAVLLVGGVSAAFAISAKKDKEAALAAAAAAAASAEQAHEEEQKARAAEEKAREEQRAEQERAAAAAAQAASKAEESKEEKEKEKAASAEESKEKEKSSAASESSKSASASTKRESSSASSKREEKESSPSAGSDQPFSKAAAVAALGAAANSAGSCKKLGGPTGTGRVTVTFATSGRVTSSNVNGAPFAGTSVGGCVASLFRKAKVPAFSGSSVTVSKSFTIN